ncbi:MAG: transcriptional regulator [Acidimicrobiales bacterium]
MTNRLSLTVAEYAEAHDLSPAHVFDLIREGRLEVLRFGKATRIPVDAKPLDAA